MYEWIGMPKSMAKWYDDEIKKIMKDNPGKLADQLKKWKLKKTQCDTVWAVYQGNFLLKIISHYPSIAGTITGKEMETFLNAVETVVIEEK